MDIASKPTRKGDKGVVMEGRLADWYAKNTGNALAGFKNDARRVAARLRSGARVLEIAPGPGYLAIALAELGDFDIVGLDISRSFVRIASQNAAKAGVAVEFTHGDASEMAFPSDSLIWAFGFLRLQQWAYPSPSKNVAKRSCVSNHVWIACVKYFYLWQ